MPSLPLAPVGKRDLKHVLVVDDERLFTQSLSEGLAGCDPSYQIHTADNGKKALQILEREKVDLVVTDIQMPVMDGFSLLAYMSRRFPQVPVLVMTAFGTEELGGRLRSLGIDSYIEKPVDLDAMARKISAALANAASGYVRGITLPSFLQVIEIERKTCAIKVSSEGREGSLYFREGLLWDAEAEGVSGAEAALELLSWQETGIDISNGCRRQERRIAATLGELLLESVRMQDEGAAKGGPAESPPGPGSGASRDAGPQASRIKERIMSVQDKMKDLSVIEGFAGAAVFTPAGESLAILAGGNGFKAEVGVLANSVLINAQKSSLEMGTGRGQQVHIEAEKAHILARCLNEGTDPLRSQPGKAHIHMVVVLSSDASIGMAKLRMNSVIEKLGEDFRQ